MKEMQKVWVVEFGEYSDRYVSGVYSSEENARVAAGDSGDITEFAIDSGIAEHQLGLIGFIVQIKKDSSVLAVEKAGHLTDAPNFSLGVGYSLGSFPEPPEPWIYDRLTAIVWARDAQHAIKIANERRAEMIASEEWQQYEDQINNDRQARFTKAS